MGIWLSTLVSIDKEIEKGESVSHLFNQVANHGAHEVDEYICQLTKSLGKRGGANFRRSRFSFFVVG